MSDDLYRYLLGGSTPRFGDTKGLIQRVRTRLQAMQGGYGPKFHSSSIQQVGQHFSDQEEEGIEGVFDLYVALIEWESGKKATLDSRRHLWDYLRKNEISDIDALVGMDKDQGKLVQIQRWVRDAFRVEPLSERDSARLENLVAILRGFLGECAHQMVEQPSEVKGVQVYRCECGAAYWTYDGNEGRYAVGG